MVELNVRKYALPKRKRIWYHILFSFSSGSFDKDKSNTQTRLSTSLKPHSSLHTLYVLSIHIHWFVPLSRTANSMMNIGKCLQENSFTASVQLQSYIFSIKFVWQGYAFRFLSHLKNSHSFLDPLSVPCTHMDEFVPICSAANRMK